MVYIDYQTHNRLAYITLNRPDKRNALNHELVKELKEAFTTAEADDNAKVIVLRATGEAFCAGADLEYLQQLQNFSYEENIADSRHLKDLFSTIYHLKKVVIAQVEGHALAGGCGLATVCDFCFAVPEAKFGYTEVKIGFIPAIVMVFLLRKVGEGTAKQLLLSGNLIDANEAKSLRLINEVVDKQHIAAHVGSFANALISSNSADAMALTKQMISQVQSMALGEALEFACERNAQARASDDCKRGIKAFLMKEKIQW